MEKAETVDSPIGIWLIGFGFSVLSVLLDEVGSISTFSFSITVSTAAEVVSTLAIGFCFTDSLLLESTIE